MCRNRLKLSITCIWCLTERLSRKEVLRKYVPLLCLLSISLYGAKPTDRLHFTIPRKIILICCLAVHYEGNYTCPRFNRTLRQRQVGATGIRQPISVHDFNPIRNLFDPSQAGFAGSLFHRRPVPD